HRLDLNVTSTNRYYRLGHESHPLNSHRGSSALRHHIWGDPGNDRRRIQRHRTVHKLGAGHVLGCERITASSIHICRFDSVMPKAKQMTDFVLYGLLKSCRTQTRLYSFVHDHDALTHIEPRLTTMHMRLIRNEMLCRCQYSHAIGCRFKIATWIVVGHKELVLAQNLRPQ